MQQAQKRKQLELYPIHTSTPASAVTVKNSYCCSKYRREKTARTVLHPSSRASAVTAKNSYCCKHAQKRKTARTGPLPLQQPSHFCDELKTCIA
jgi:hypothetical protein